MIGIAVFGVLHFTGCKDNSYDPIPVAESGNIKTSEDSTDYYINRGEYLVTVMGCNDCHSPKRMGERGPELIPELKLSGYPSGNPLPEISAEALENGWVMMSPDLSSAVGPWGISFAANLTSDDTGIGTWSFEQFKRALTEGRYKGLENTRGLLPPMPWENFKNMKEEDLKAVFEYLQSTPPVENVVPAPVPPNQINDA